LRIKGGVELEWMGIKIPEKEKGAASASPIIQLQTIIKKEILLKESNQ
jgi:hypothetical protein